MKHTKEFLFHIALTLLLVCMFCLAGCRQEGGGGNPTGSVPPETQKETVSSETPPAVVPDVLALVHDGTPAKVVLPFGAGEGQTAAAESIAKMLSTVSGTNVRVSSDSASYDADAVEILVGATAYPESRIAAAELSYGDWGVMAVGSKVVVYAYLDSLYTSAGKDLIAVLFAQKGQEGDAVIASDYRKTETVNTAVNAIPRMENTEPSSVYVTGLRETCWGLIFSDVTGTDFKAYQERLGAAGFSLHAENEINSNCYVTYTDSTYVLHAMFLPSQRRIQVSVEKLTDTALPGTEQENVYTPGVCETTVTQLGQWIGYSETDSWDAWINGLSHVIRLEDGSFLIIDGGHDRKMNDELLYKTLKKQAPDPDHIVVAAWIFTHAHGDHVGTFLMFDHDDVTVERFIFNFPTYSESAKLGCGGTVTSTVSKIKSGYPEAEIVSAHPGQLFFIRNAKVEMLWTLDLFYPKDFTFFNESSLVFSVELEGQKLMYLGDMGPASNPVLCQLYGDALASDIVQTAHHGFEGASFTTYSLIKPKYVFWNTGFTSGTMDQNGNNYFSRNDEIVKWIAMDTVTVVTLKEEETPCAEIFENSSAYFAED